jgi:hypothetical protein
MFYKALGFLVWKLGRRYLRGRLGGMAADARHTSSRIGAGALVATGVAVATVLARKRRGAATG